METSEPLPDQTYHHGNTRAVVRPLSRASGRPCARPGCPAPAAATLVFRYASQQAWLRTLEEEPRPDTYDLCPRHADRTSPPHGWDLVDDRPLDETGRDGGEDDGIGGEHTVAVLAEALRRTGRPRVPEPGTAADEGASPPLDGDPLREALEELQAVALGDSGDPPQAPPTTSSAVIDTTVDPCEDVGAPIQPRLDDAIGNAPEGARDLPAADERARTSDVDMSDAPPGRPPLARRDA